MGFNIGKFVTGNLNSLSTNISSLLGKTGNGDGATKSTLLTQPFNNNQQNDLTMRNLSFSYLPTQESAADKKKLQTYRVEIPLAKGSQKASYEELSRRAMRTALELNGIKPTMRELEEMMTTLDKRPIDFDIKSDDPATFRATMATPKHIGTTASGEKVMGYSFEMDDKFQRTTIKDYKAAQAALAGKPEEKAVVDMNLTERMGEAIKIAYEKGHISKEVREQLGNMTPTELTVAFGMGGAASLAAKGGASVVLAPAGAALLGMEMIKNGAELETFGKACAKATSRAELEQPAAEFGRWTGELSKAGVLATAAGAGAKIAPGMMPKARAAAEGFFTTTVKGAKDLMRSTKGALAPELVTPEGVTIRTPTAKTPVDKINDPTEMRGQGGYESNEVTTSGGTKMPRVRQPHEVAPSMKPNEANRPLGNVEKTPVKADAELVRGLSRQNEAAQTLAKNGYQVEQKPQLTDRMSNQWLDKNKKPDFKVEGEIFDAYSPSGVKSARNMRSEMESKIRQGQTRRIVLNMDDSKVELEELKKVIWEKPIIELEQILVVKDGKVSKFFPFN